MKNWNVRKAVVAREDMPEEHRLKQSLSWPHLVALGVGAIVGTGILTLIGVGAGKAGPAFQEPYAATKAALIAFTASLRATYHGTGVSASAGVSGTILVVPSAIVALRARKVDLSGIIWGRPALCQSRRAYQRLSQRRAKPNSPCGMKITIAMNISPTGIR